jgi:hypothetical protein
VKERSIQLVEVAVETHERLSDIVDRTGSSSVTVVSRLVQWFASQNADVQEQILNANGNGDSFALLLKAIAKAAAKNGDQ